MTIKRCGNSWEEDIHLDTAGERGCDENPISSRTDWTLTCGSRWHSRRTPLQPPQGATVAERALKGRKRWDLLCDLNKGRSHSQVGAGKGRAGPGVVCPAPPWGSSVRPGLAKGRGPGTEGLCAGPTDAT